MKYTDIHFGFYSANAVTPQNRLSVHRLLRSLWIIRCWNVNSARLDRLRTTKCSFSFNVCLLGVSRLSWNAPQSITRSMNPFICSRTSGVVSYEPTTKRLEVQSQETLSTAADAKCTSDVISFERMIPRVAETRHKTKRNPLTWDLDVFFLY